MDEKALKDAWKSFTKTLEDAGEKLPSEDAGSIYYNPYTQKAERVKLMDGATLQNLLKGGTKNGADTNKLTNEEWVQKIRKMCGDSLTPHEKDVICDRFVFGDTFEQIAKSRNFTGGRQSVSKVFNRGLKKLRRKLERTVVRNQR